MNGIFASSGVTIQNGCTCTLPRQLNAQLLIFETRSLLSLNNTRTRTRTECPLDGNSILCVLSSFFERIGGAKTYRSWSSEIGKRQRNMSDGAQHDQKTPNIAFSLASRPQSHNVAPLKISVVSKIQRLGR